MYCDVISDVNERTISLDKSSIRPPSQRAKKQLEQQRSVLKVGNGYKGKYPSDTNLWAVVRYLANEPNHKKKLV